jgi:hypothetical protein
MGNTAGDLGSGVGSSAGDLASGLGDALTGLGL